MQFGFANLASLIPDNDDDLEEIGLRKSRKNDTSSSTSTASSSSSAPSKSSSSPPPATTTTSSSSSSSSSHTSRYSLLGEIPLNNSNSRGKKGVAFGANLWDVTGEISDMKRKSGRVRKVGTPTARRDQRNDEEADDEVDSGNETTAAGKQRMREKPSDAAVWDIYMSKAKIGKETKAYEDNLIKSIFGNQELLRDNESIRRVQDEAKRPRKASSAASAIVQKKREESAARVGSGFGRGYPKMHPSKRKSTQESPVRLVLDENRGDSLCANLNFWLMPYQQEGVRFLYEMWKSTVPGAILGDDMGLGKTIQSACFLSAMFRKTGTRADEIKVRRMLSGIPDGTLRQNPVAIIVPASLQAQWVDELGVWGSFAVKSMDRKTSAEEGKILSAAKSRMLEIVIVSYTRFERMMRESSASHSHTRLSFAEIEWGAIILDEAHVLKNDKTKRYKAVHNLNLSRNPPFKIALSGTPMQNNISELFNFVDCIVPGHFGQSKKAFLEHYEKPILRGRAVDATSAERSEASIKRDELICRLQEIQLRRIKDKILKDELPQKNSSLILCSMRGVQESAYKRALQLPEFQYIIRQDEVCDCERGREEKRTRGCCCYEVPRNGIMWLHQHKDGRACKSCPGCMGLVCMDLLSKISNHLELLKPQLSLRDVNPEDYEYRKALCKAVLGPDLVALGGCREVTNFFKLTDVKNCAKLRYLDSTLRSFYSEPDRPKVLIFSKYTKILDILEKFCESKAYQFCRLDGTMSSKKKTRAISEFQSNPTMFIFLLSTGAGSVGLNLTVANRVILFEPDWNPTSGQQAQDRSFRIGQKDDVKVYKLTTTGTIDEQVLLREAMKTSVLKHVLENKSSKRTLKGTAGEKVEGEIYGLKNLFTYQPDGVMDGILKRNERERAQASLAVAAAGIGVAAGAGAAVGAAEGIGRGAGAGPTEGLGRGAAAGPTEGLGRGAGAGPTEGLETGAGTQARRKTKVRTGAAAGAGAGAQSKAEAQSKAGAETGATVSGAAQSASSGGKKSRPRGKKRPLATLQLHASNHASVEKSTAGKSGMETLRELRPNGMLNTRRKQSPERAKLTLYFQEMNRKYYEKFPEEKKVLQRRMVTIGNERPTATREQRQARLLTRRLAIDAVEENPNAAKNAPKAPDFLSYLIQKEK